MSIKQRTILVRVVADPYLSSVAEDCRVSSKIGRGAAVPENHNRDCVDRINWPTRGVLFHGFGPVARF